MQSSNAYICGKTKNKNKLILTQNLEYSLPLGKGRK